MGSDGRGCYGLLAHGGRRAVSVRATASAAGLRQRHVTQLFGDTSGVLRAVAAQGLDRYARAEARADRLDDPVEDLRVGWDRHIEFGLANPELYALIWGEHLVPARAAEARKADRILRARVHRIEVAGRLSVSEADATWLVLAIGTGVTLALLASGQAPRELQAALLAREAVLSAITTDVRTSPLPELHLPVDG